MYERSSGTSNERIGRAMQNLVADVKVLASDTRDLLRQTTGLSGEQFARVRERTRDTLAAVEHRLGPLQQRVAEHLGPLQQRVAEHGRHAAEVSAEHLRVHRWSTLAAAAAIAFAIAAVLAWQSERPSDDYTEQ
jgi:ElaB/YqjD/DUF883 family membrane-anchored ribosome-binding protein